jgi:hypothetical protein
MVLFGERLFVPLPMKASKDLNIVTAPSQFLAQRQGIGLPVTSCLRKAATYSDRDLHRLAPPPPCADWAAPLPSRLVRGSATTRAYLLEQILVERKNMILTELAP